MRILFIGDIVGKAGRRAVQDRLPALRLAWKLDLVVINGENAAHGFGITPEIADGLFDAGADVVTLGNHSFDQREIMVHMAREPRIIRPVNYPGNTPGKGQAMVETKSGRRALVVNLIGRIYLGLADCPFVAADRLFEETRLGRDCDAILVDLHAEASSEKMSMGHHLDGRVSVVVGTHTHVPTADERVLPGGTAYQTDAGMTGDYDSVIGMDKREPMRRFVDVTPSAKMEPATGEATLCGLAVETDDATGLAIRVAPVRLGGKLAEARPPFWS